MKKYILESSGIFMAEDLDDALVKLKYFFNDLSNRQHNDIFFEGKVKVKPVKDTDE